MKKHCAKHGLPVARVDVIVPLFQEGRMTKNKAELQELFGLLDDDSLDAVEKSEDNSEQSED